MEKDDEELELPDSFFESLHDNLSELNVLDSWQPTVEVSNSTKEDLTNRGNNLKNRIGEEAQNTTDSDGSENPRVELQKSKSTEDTQQTTVGKSSEKQRSPVRRDPNKTKRDIELDKNRIEKISTEETLFKNINIVNTGLVPPGMEDEIDDYESEIIGQQIQRDIDEIELRLDGLDKKLKEDYHSLSKDKSSKGADKPRSLKYRPHGSSPARVNFNKRRRSGSSNNSRPTTPTHFRSSRTKRFSPRFRDKKRNSRSNSLETRRLNRRNDQRRSRGRIRDRNRVSRSDSSESRRLNRSSDYRGLRNTHDKSSYRYSSKHSKGRRSYSRSRSGSRNRSRSRQKHSPLKSKPSGAEFIQDLFAKFRPVQETNLQTPTSYRLPVNHVVTNLAPYQNPNANVNLTYPVTNSVYPNNFVVKSSVEETKYGVGPYIEPAAESFPIQGPLENLQVSVSNNDFVAGQSSQMNDLRQIINAKLGAKSSVTKPSEEKHLSLSDLLSASVKVLCGRSKSLLEGSMANTRSKEAFNRIQDAIKILCDDKKLKTNFIPTKKQTPSLCFEINKQTKWQSPLKGIEYSSELSRLQFSHKSESETEAQRELRKICARLGLDTNIDEIKRNLNKQSITSKSEKSFNAHSKAEIPKENDCPVCQLKKINITDKACQTDIKTTQDVGCQFVESDFKTSSDQTTSVLSSQSLSHLTPSQLLQLQNHTNMPSNSTPANSSYAQYGSGNAFQYPGMLSSQPQSSFVPMHQLNQSNYGYGANNANYYGNNSYRNMNNANGPRPKPGFQNQKNIKKWY